MLDSPTILSVDGNRRNAELLTRVLQQAGFRTRVAPDLEALDALLDESTPGIVLGLVDLGYFNGQVWTRCQRLGERGIPWLVLCSATQQAAAQRQALLYRGRGVLVKPLSPRSLVQSIHAVLEPRP